MEAAEKTGVLSLPGHKLKELPYLTHKLRVLDVSENSLTSLPVLPASLKTLKIAKNKFKTLETLPERLVTLDATENELVGTKRLPPALETLALRGNLNLHLPVLHLPKLKTLDLRSCGIRDLSDNIVKSTLSLLQELLLDENLVEVVPEQLLSACPKLKRLSLEHNRIKTLPSVLLKSPNLDRLDLKGNPISKSTFLKLDGVDDFLKRREKTRLKDTAIGAIADLSVCGLDDD